MKRAKKIILIVAALLVLGAVLIIRPWHLDKITIMSPVLQKNITVNGRLLRSTGTIKVWVPGHDEKRQQTKNDTTIIINQYVPAQMLYFPQETVGLVVVE